MNIVILIFVSVVIFFLLQANKEYKQADKNINSLILEAANATSNGDYNKAIQLLTSALHQNTMYHNVWNSRGENYMKLKMYEQALADFNKSISINPDRNINYTAYTNKEKVDKIIYNKTPPSSIINETKKLTLFDIKLNEECIYVFSNLSPYKFNQGTGEKISEAPQSITINLKDKIVSFVSFQIQLLSLSKQLIIIEISYDAENDMHILFLADECFKEYVDNKYVNLQNVVSVKFYIKNNVIGFINNFDHGAIFNYNSNWILEKH